jgi:flagellar basal-body rod modification protein FlgD
MASISGLSFPTISDTSATQNQSSGQSQDKSINDIGESDFLKLLVAQLQNQDPLSPIQNEEFVTQLATFSSLEQLISINKAVTKLADPADAGTTGENSNTNIASI